MCTVYYFCTRVKLFLCQKPILFSTHNHDVNLPDEKILPTIQKMSSFLLLHTVKRIYIFDKSLKFNFPPESDQIGLLNIQSVSSKIMQPCITTPPLCVALDSIIHNLRHTMHWLKHPLLWTNCWIWWWKSSLIFCSFFEARFNTQGYMWAEEI